jgi:hypothetical protein
MPRYLTPKSPSVLTITRGIVMSAKHIVPVIAVVLIVSSLSWAQAVQVKTPPSPAKQDDKQKQKSIISKNVPQESAPPFVGVTPVALPEGSASWVVQVVTGGGFSGAVTDALTISSGGSLACPGSKAKPLVPEAVQSLTQLVASVRPLTPPLQETVSMCNDCSQTTLIIWRRESDRNVKTIAATWNELTKGRVPDDILRLYEEIATLSNCAR